MRRDDVLIVGGSAFSSVGLGLKVHVAALVDGAPVDSCLGMDTAQLLPERRLRQAVSLRDARGLATLVDALAESGYQPQSFQPERVGLFVGAPPCSPFDADPYQDSLAAARDEEGHVDLQVFGGACQRAKPTTLLLGLPNNVLCHGSIKLDARGSHSNYVGGPVSGHLALINAARRIGRGQLDFAMAGAYSSSCSEFTAALWRHLGWDFGHEPTDGSVFLSLESRASAEARHAQILAEYVHGVAWDTGAGPFRALSPATGCAEVLRQLLESSCLTADDVGLLLVNTPKSDAATLRDALAGVFGRRLPAVGTLLGFGHMQEAAGMLEVALAGDLLARDALLESVALPGFPAALAPSRPISLIVVGTPAGAYTAVATSIHPRH
jgi:3-oxoacyl-[acyl-carrier-protein] synthase-1